MGELRQTVQTLHDELTQAQKLGPDDRALLESALRDIRRALDGTVDAAAADQGDLLEGAAVRLEAGHPGLAGAIRSVLDALAKAGI